MLTPKFGLIFALVLSTPAAWSADKHILLIAGPRSHGPGDHEFRAGCLLLQKCLDQLPGIGTAVYSNGWPQAETAFENIDAVVLYSDGGGGHPFLQEKRPTVIDRLAQQGVGIGCAHFAVEVPPGKSGETMQRWIGGYYEHLYSVNPMWSPEFNSFPNHPVARGVQPFSVRDEWYFNMRWNPDHKGLVPILVAKPSDAVRDGPYVYPRGPYPHIVEAKGREETLLWLYERPEGGRSFGFTGGHYHSNWADPNYRKVVLNAILWIAKADIPTQGAETTIAPEDLKLNLDPKGK